MKSHEIRETFLDYFAKQDHKIIKSSSLLPQDDPTILFTNAGMNQFKNVFLGLDKRSYRRATSVQKCMRVSGKHNDFEQVGVTLKHHTFFEMLGNFSFGDYFKQKAIIFGWELLIEVYKLGREHLYVTVFEEDDEAYDIWSREIGIPEDRIFRLGKEDNYWSMGETGPCGPCSEIHYDLEPSNPEGTPQQLIESGDDRFVELWNLVFMQFNQEKDGSIRPLPSPSVDTGMGLERMAMVLQQKYSNYDTDLFIPIIEAVCSRCDREYQPEAEFSVSARIIADHIRALAFLIGDGIMPANDGRGYVLRRLIRRAYRAGNKLGVEEPFLFELVGIVCDIMKDAYPELLASAGYIAKVCQSEEQRFALTLNSGIRTFNQYTLEANESGATTLSGDKVFKLYDTFGFPPDLSAELAAEKNMSIDEEGFQEELEKQKERARLSWKGDSRQEELKVYHKVKDLTSIFRGYDTLAVPETKVLAVLRKGKAVAEIAEGELAEVLLQETPFYAEAGGQVGDSGILKNAYFSALVVNVISPIPDLIIHEVKVLSGTLKKGDLIEAAVELPRRQAITKNHSATHLLHAALRQVLGDHVKQAGSLVSPERLRFDFTHFSPVSPAEIKSLEAIINVKIREVIPVKSKVTSMEEGIKEGAVAIFEEKYKEDVRVVTMGSFSKELCGGVHVRNTGEIGLFKIISEGSVAAGMRRIEAVTGEIALEFTQDNDELLNDILQLLNATRNEAVEQLDRLKITLKDKEKELKVLRQKLARADFTEKQEDVENIQGIPVLIKKLTGLSNSELRELADSLKQKIGSGIVVLGSISDEKAILVVSVSREHTDRIRADELIRRISPVIGGGGGGRPDFAQAGGSKTTKLAEALEQSLTAIKDML